MGVSLLGPGVLLVAAVVLVAGGSGLGGLGSLGQISSGPTLPDTGLALSREASLDQVELATAGLATGGAPIRPDAGPTQGFKPAGAEGSQTPAGGPRGTLTPAPGPPRSQPRVTGQPPAVPVSPTPAPQPPPPLPADPVKDVAETTRGLEPLPDALGPTFDDIVDSLLNPGR
jgi:hypothetical protein